MNRHHPAYSKPELVKVDYLKTLPRAKRAYRLFVFGAIKHVIENDEVDEMLEIFADLAPKDQLEIFQLGCINDLIEPKHPNRAHVLLNTIARMPNELKIESLRCVNYQSITSGHGRELLDVIGELDKQDQHFALTSNGLKALVLYGLEPQLRELAANWPADSQSPLAYSIKQAHTELAARPERYSTRAARAAIEANQRPAIRRAKIQAPSNG